MVPSSKTEEHSTFWRKSNFSLAVEGNSDKNCQRTANAHPSKSKVCINTEVLVDRYSAFAGTDAFTTVVMVVQWGLWGGRWNSQRERQLHPVCYPIPSSAKS